MLVNAYKECYNQLPGTVDGCAVFEASRDKAKADNCRSTGDVVNEVRDRPCQHCLIQSTVCYLQAIGVEIPLAQLPGNNPEFNSSRDSPDYPKRFFPDYVETAKVVKVDALGSGTCTNIKCSDYSA